MSSAAANPLTSLSPAWQARPTVIVRRSPAAAAATEPRQRRRLDRDDDADEPHSDTAVGTATAGSSSQSQSPAPPALPKDTNVNVNDDDDDDGSSYSDAMSGASDSEDSVPAAPRGSTGRRPSARLRLRGVRDEPSEDGAERHITADLMRR
jgi:hypothetical protein